MKQLFILILFVFCNGIQAQKYYTGLLPDDKEAEKIPQKPQLLTRDFKVLPKSYSLKQYCPTLKSQGQHGTCTSWATTYAARTICEAINNKWTDKAKIDKEAFAPIFVYYQIKDADDVECQNGSYISDAFKLLQSKGAPKYKDFETQCAERIPQQLFETAKDYVIDDYFRLFSSNDSRTKKIENTKKALSENKPVVVCMAVYESFSDAKDKWNGVKKAGEKPGYHAMCAVAYDDEKYGGAFLLMNSWDTNWGNGGFTWISYDDYCANCDHAYEMYIKPKAQPTPQPTPPVVKGGAPIIEWINKATTSASKIYRVQAGIKSESEVLETGVTVNGQKYRGTTVVVNDGYAIKIHMDVTLREGRNEIAMSAKNANGTTERKLIVTYGEAVKKNVLSGSMYLQLATGEKMVPQLKQGKGMPYYEMEGGYISGTRYRLYVSNDSPAYVYIIGSDLKNSVSKLFPQNELVSPALVYKSNNIAIPDEKYYIEMDDTKGRDYICVLYSENALPIDEMISEIKQTEGSFTTKVAKALGNIAASLQEMRVKENEISFRAETAKNVVPIIVEIAHI